MATLSEFAFEFSFRKSCLGYVDGGGNLSTMEDLLSLWWNIFRTLFRLGFAGTVVDSMFTPRFNREAIEALERFEPKRTPPAQGEKVEEAGASEGGEEAVGAIEDESSLEGGNIVHMQVMGMLTQVFADAYAWPWHT